MGLSPDEYGGEVGVLLSYNSLEFNSRLCLCLLESIHALPEGDRLIYQLDKLSPHQWFHYLANQTGYLNIEQIKFELDDAFVWLNEMLDRYGDNQSIRSELCKLLDGFSDKIVKFGCERLGKA